MMEWALDREVCGDWQHAASSCQCAGWRQDRRAPHLQAAVGRGAQQHLGRHQREVVGVKAGGAVQLQQGRGVAGRGACGSSWILCPTALTNVF